MPRVDFQLPFYTLVRPDWSGPFLLNLFTGDRPTANFIALFSSAENARLFAERLGADTRVGALNDGRALYEFLHCPPHKFGEPLYDFLIAYDPVDSNNGGFQFTRLEFEQACVSLPGI